MPAALTAEAIIDRELEKYEAKRDRLRADLEDAERQAARLMLARKALEGDADPVSATA